MHPISRDVRLPTILADRLDARAQALLAFGSLLEDKHCATPDERQALAQLSERLHNTCPYPEACYAGQMLKPPAAIAWAAYATAMLLNPNNHALDGGPATARWRTTPSPRSQRCLAFPDASGI